MATIVEYSDTKAPRNLYPTRIISPAHPNPCCATRMEALGAVERDSRWEYRYARCSECGFTVRTIVRPLPDEAVARALRQVLQKTFQRNAPEY